MADAANQKHISIWSEAGYRTAPIATAAWLQQPSIGGRFSRRMIHHPPLVVAAAGIFEAAAPSIREEEANVLDHPFIRITDRTSGK